MKFEKKKYDQELQKHDQKLHLKQELVQLSSFLTQSGPAPQNIQLPQETHALAEILFLMSKADVSVPFSWNDYKFNPASQMLILNALFDIWLQLEANLEQINNDIQRLNQAGQGTLLSIETQVRIQALNQEINSLSDQMEIDDSDETRDLWISKRRELRELKLSSDGLTHPCYTLFNDSERFVHVDDARELSQILSSRLEVLRGIKKDYHNKLSIILIGLNNTIAQIDTAVPNDEGVKHEQAQVENLREQYQLLQTHYRALNDKRDEHLKLQNFASGFDFSSALDAIKQHLNNLEEEFNKSYESDQAWQPLFEQWRAILQEKDQANQDWEQLQDIYPASCNLAAISCNERE